MFKVAVCDDETVFSGELAAMITNYMEKKGIACEVTSFTSGREFIDQDMEILQYRIVFLDINMEGMDGMETARRIRTLSDDTYIVFVTAFLDYMQEGYKVDAVRYILKDMEQLGESVSECMDAILGKMKYVTKEKTYTFNERTRTISPNRIVYIASSLHTLEYHVMEDEQKVYTRTDTLNNVETEFVPYGFVRVHQSFLVNLKYMKSVKPYELLLSTGEKLIIPKPRYRTVKDAFVAYRGGF